MGDAANLPSCGPLLILFNAPRLWGPQKTVEVMRPSIDLWDSVGVVP